MYQHQCHADADGRICHIERGKVMSGNVKIKKIDHCIKAQTVDHIADRTTQYERERHG